MITLIDGEGIVEAADVADDKKRVTEDMQGAVGVGTQHFLEGGVKGLRRLRLRCFLPLGM